MKTLANRALGASRDTRLCSMAVCGNRLRARRHYERIRA
jgi:predicted RNA-binding Zn ribbon-like protein